MPINIQMHKGLLELVFHGDVGEADFMAVVESVHDIEARLEVTPDRVADLSAANMMPLNADVLRRYAISRTAMPLKNKVKSAIIAPKPDQFGLARMFQAFNENPSIEIKLFRDAASAYAWLGRTAKSA
jgi:hypothetical protein